jgi:chaperonin GroES
MSFSVPIPELSCSSCRRFVLLSSRVCSRRNQATVVEVGPGARSKDGSLIAPSVKKGDRVLLPEYGGSPVKLGDVEYVLYRNDDILGLLENK